MPRLKIGDQFVKLGDQYLRIGPVEDESAGGCRLDLLAFDNAATPDNIVMTYDTPAGGDCFLVLALRVQGNGTGKVITSTQTWAEDETVGLQDTLYLMTSVVAGGLTGQTFEAEFDSGSYTQMQAILLIFTEWTVLDPNTQFAGLAEDNPTSTTFAQTLAVASGTDGFAYAFLAGPAGWVNSDGYSTLKTVAGGGLSQLTAVKKTLPLASDTINWSGTNGRLVGYFGEVTCT